MYLAIISSISSFHFFSLSIIREYREGIYSGGTILILDWKSDAYYRHHYRRKQNPLITIVTLCLQAARVSLNKILTNTDITAAETALPIMEI